MCSIRASRATRVGLIMLQNSVRVASLSTIHDDTGLLRDLGPTQHSRRLPDKFKNSSGAELSALLGLWEILGII